MHMLIEGLQGVEAIADYFVIVGYGDTEKQATASHDDHLSAFIQQCIEKGVKLNARRCRLEDGKCHSLVI